MAEPDRTTAVPDSARSVGALYLSFVHELAACVDVWQHMQHEHVPTAEGFCVARVCGRGGCGSPHFHWPCPTRRLADWASEAHHAQLRAARQRAPQK